MTDNSQTTDLDIIQPCYNPHLNWEKNFIKYCCDLKKLLPEIAIGFIIVNDGSTKNFDNEHIKWIKSQIKDVSFLSYPENKGKGFALRKAIAQSKAKYHICTDIDFPFDLHYIVEIYNKLENGADIVAGIRNKDYYNKLSFKRLISSKFSQILNRIFLEVPFGDTQAGLKGMNSKGKEIFLKTKIDRFLFDTEFLSKAAKYKDISIETCGITVRDGVNFSNFSYKTMIHELGNFVRIYLKK